MFEQRLQIRAAYNQLGLQKGIQTDTNNIQPRIGLAWDPKGDGKSVFRASYGIFYDHPLLGLYFLGDASDGSKSGQLLFAGGAPCDGTAPGSPGNLNATSVVRTGGYPVPRRAWPIGTRRDDLRLGVGRFGHWRRLLLHI